MLGKPRQPRPKKSGRERVCTEGWASGASGQNQTRRDDILTWPSAKLVVSFLLFFGQRAYILSGDRDAGWRKEKALFIRGVVTLQSCLLQFSTLLGFGDTRT